MFFVSPVNVQPYSLGIHFIDSERRFAQISHRYFVAVEVGIQVDVNPVRLADFVYELTHLNKGQDGERIGVTPVFHARLPA